MHSIKDLSYDKLVEILKAVIKKVYPVVLAVLFGVLILSSISYQRVDPITKEQQEYYKELAIKVFENKCNKESIPEGVTIVRTNSRIEVSNFENFGKIILQEIDGVPRVSVDLSEVNFYRVMYALMYILLTAIFLITIVVILFILKRNFKVLKKLYEKRKIKGIKPVH